MNFLCVLLRHKKGRYMGVGHVVVAPSGSMFEFDVPGEWHVYECARCKEYFSKWRAESKEFGATKDMAI